MVYSRTPVGQEKGQDPPYVQSQARFPHTIPQFPAQLLSPCLQQTLQLYSQKSQSSGQPSHSPTPSQTPLPHVLPSPQSPGQEVKLSPQPGSHRPFPQGTGQSVRHQVQFSEPLHVPSPQKRVGLWGQSAGQVHGSSGGSH